MLDHALIVVCGKGGVGKSTVAAALALAAARRGRHTLVAEVSGRQDVARLLGVASPPSDRPRALTDQLDHLSVDADHALTGYLRAQMPRPLADLVAHSHALAPLAAAAPGLRELLSLGQVWELTRPGKRHDAYDTVVLDAPATGHGLAMLAAPRTYAETLSGPVGHQAGDIDRDLHDPAVTAIVAVATAEELAVHEAIALRDGVRASLGMALAAVVANALLPRPLAAQDVAVLAARREDPAVASALWLQARSDAQEEHVAQLQRAGDGAPLIRLPLVVGRQVDRGALEDLAGLMETA